MCRSHAEKVTANHIRQPLVWSSEPVLGFKWILSAESAGILVLVGTVMLGFPRPCDQPGTALLALILPRNRSAVSASNGLGRSGAKTTVFGHQSLKPCTDPFRNVGLSLAMSLGIH